MAVQTCNNTVVSNKPLMRGQICHKPHPKNGIDGIGFNSIQNPNKVNPQENTISESELSQIADEFSNNLKETTRVNEETITKTTKGLEQQVDNQVIEKLIEQALTGSGDDENPAMDLSQLIKGKGRNGGQIYNLNSITNEGLTTNLSLCDSVSVKNINKVPDKLKKNFCTSVESRKKFQKPIDKGRITRKVLEYLTGKKYLDKIKNMKPGATLVLEKTRSNIPLITASKDSNGGIIININKNGMQVKIVLSGSDLNKDSLPDKQNSNIKPQFASLTKNFGGNVIG